MKLGQKFVSITMSFVFLTNIVAVSADAESLLGDINCNGEIEIHDVIQYMTYAMSPEDNSDNGDYNQDGVVNDNDIVELGKYLLKYPSFPSSKNNHFIDATGGGIAVGNVITTVKEDSVIEVPLNLTGDINSTGCLIEVTYDEKLKLNYFDSFSSDINTAGIARAIFVSPLILEENFSSLEFECPDMVGKYDINLTIYALDCGGSYVSNPIAKGGTITVVANGDISCSCSIDIYDAIEISKFVMDMRTLTEEEKEIADYNGDEIVDIYDAIGIATEILSK